MNRYDIAIIGAGIAGASLAAELARHASVVILEAEDQPGYHATGRSAAFWSETYGGPGIQPLTSLSGPVLRAHGFLTDLGSLHIGRREDRAKFESFMAAFADAKVPLHFVEPGDYVPGLRPDWTIGLFEPSCAAIDVGGYHGLCLKVARTAGAILACRARVTALSRTGSDWRIETTAATYHAGIIVNAAGAWATGLSAMAGAQPIAITPYRRTMVQLRTRPAPLASIPHVVGISGDFYFKPEAGGTLWLSPHDETPSLPVDAAPEELDVAIALNRLEHVVDWAVEAVEHQWAGLRSFAPDRLPIFGFDHQAPGFFWCAGQGGFGIQTGPAAAHLAASILLGTTGGLTGAIDPLPYLPDRFQG